MDEYILVIGSTMIDIYGKQNLYNLKGCNSGNIFITHGGVARNIAENLARINVKTKFITVFGDDNYSLAMKNHLLDLNCDISKSITVANQQGASFMALVDERYNIISAVADVKIMHHLTIDKFSDCNDIIRGAKYVVFDANDYEIYQYIIKSYYKECNFIVDTVSVNKAKRIKHLIPYFHTIKCNLREAEELLSIKLQTEDDLRKAGKTFIKKGINKIFITLDENGVYYNDGEVEGIMYAETSKIINPIGAGDAFVAGVIKGYLENYSIIEIIKLATSMSIINVEDEKTVNSNLSAEYLKDVNNNLVFNNIKF